MAKRLVELFAVTVASLLGGCSPCAGVENCDQPAEALLQGQIVEAATGAPSPGVRVEVIRTGGALSAAHTALFTTDATGVFEGSLGQLEEGYGDVIVTIIVSSEDSRYRVEGVPIPAARVRGAAHVIGPWVRRPFFNYIGELWRADNPADRLASTWVEFRRTGGPVLSGQVDVRGYYEAFSDVAGRFYLMGTNVTTPGLGPVRGTIEVKDPDGTWRVIAEHTLFPTHIFRPAFGVVVLPFAAPSAPTP